MGNFKPFGQAVRAQFDELANSRLLYVVDISGDDIWNAYLQAFPAGTNPVFRERTEHDCSCCKAFIRQLGGVVCFDDSGELRTVWEVDVPEPYRTVAARLHALVRTANIRDVYKSSEPKHGAAQTREQDGDTARTWDHFCGEVPRSHVMRKSRIAAYQGDMHTNAEMLERALEEFRAEDVAQVLELIDANQLYRGAEHRELLQSFATLQSEYLARRFNSAERFVWRHVTHRAARIRNTVIGSLLIDLSENKSLEEAVAAFEAKVAPQNYQRTSAIITPRMVEHALATVDDLGLRSALERRHARFSDVSVNDVLYVDGSVRPAMRDELADTLLGAAKPKRRARATQDAERVSMETFIEDILPGASTVKLTLAPEHQGNFVSLTAPVHADAQPLFKWGNGFAWSYTGDAADSIKQRVKRAGGNVDNALLRISLAWFNYDDLDIHCETPDGTHIYFNDKCGVLDVDMNAGRRQSREPVENLSFLSLQSGAYRVWVNNYHKRENIDGGFEMEVEHAGQVQLWRAYRSPSDGHNFGCFSVIVKNESVQEIRMVANNGLEFGNVREQEHWGVVTGHPVTVQSIITSPNHWGEKTSGNKHWLFVLEGCRNPDPVRGIYNEFLRNDLREHRKVFEVLGDKTKAPYSEDQMSGVGFSSTLPAQVSVSVDGRPYLVEVVR